MSTSAAKATASGGSGVGPNRRKWDMDEYGEKARQRDREDKERAQENEERVRKGQKPLTKKRQEILPKATETLKAREEDLEIEKNQGKTLMVDGAQGGRKGPGFHCQACNRTFKDSLAYLDHVNGRLRECSFLAGREILLIHLSSRSEKAGTDDTGGSLNIGTSTNSFRILARRNEEKV